MYSTNSHYRSLSGSQYSNNPFIDGTDQTQERFPDINTIDRATGGAGPSYGTNGGNGYDTGAGAVGGYGYGQQPSYSMQQQQQQPQAQPYGGLGASTPGYSTFAASVSPQMSGMPYQQQQQPSLSYGQQQQYQGQGQGYATPQYSGYPAQGYGMGTQTQTGNQQTPSFLAEFDPYTNASSGGAGAVGTSQSQFSQTSSASAQGGREHPRDYVRSHRRELDIWDSVSWKQALNAFDALKSSWEERKGAIAMQLRQGGYYMHPQEQQRMQGLLKEATENIDTIAASSIQMQEVLAGYRHSSDLASKNRVRSSLNAALQSLPDWPQS